MPRNTRKKRGYTTQLDCIRVSESDEASEEEVVLATAAEQATETTNNARPRSEQFKRTVDLVMQVTRLIGFAVWMIVRAVATTFPLHR